MDPLKVLVVLVLGNSLTHAFFKKITRVIRRPCSWKVCKGHEWKNDWSPTSIPQGKCITQNRKAHHSYTELKGNLICPPTVPCANLDQKRSICKYFTVCTFVFRNDPLLQHKIDMNVKVKFHTLQIKRKRWWLGLNFTVLKHNCLFSPQFERALIIKLSCVRFPEERMIVIEQNTPCFRIAKCWITQEICTSIQNHSLLRNRNSILIRHWHLHFSDSFCTFSDSISLKVLE